MKKIIALLLIIISVYNIQAADLTENNNIRKFELPEVVYVADDKIYLNDIISGIGEDIYISKSSVPGTKKFVTKNYIERLLKNSVSENIEVTGPEKIIIERQGQKLDIQNMKNYVLNAIVEKLEGIDKKDISIEFAEISYNKYLPLGEVKFEISFSKTEDFKNSVIAYIGIIVDGKLYDKIYVRSKVRVWDNVLKTNKSLKWPYKISASDVYEEKMEITGIRGTIIKSFDELNNKLVKKILLPNEILIEESFVDEPLIKRGSEVKIISKTGNITVSTSGIAKENGYRNQTLRVENIASNKIVRGKVIDKNTIIIE
ncbi:flagellar basal body P-ring formation protein FlgA [Candidatus Dependentiae bacterium]|nr:flagellar basal body P-ring formation protein FlgA [Candidatus Dependentiae bacterium]